MEQVADKVQQEYWRPVVAAGKREAGPAAVRSQVEVCESCGTEFVMGARFCHVCGGGRQAVASETPRWMEILDFHQIRHALGLSTGSMVAFIFGLVAVVAAVSVGFIYSANTLVDWQAVQTWRIEWMLAAIVAFTAGVLLKKPE
ncbi:MAG TPA: hypothetical protein VG897_03990 [Terriglobales bacterium]|nr:hypothetical protein [Terriglobales bacterium]